MNRKSRAMIEQVRHLHAEGRSIKRIAQALALSRNTVRRYLRESPTIPVQASAPTTTGKVDPFPHVDWDKVIQEIALGRPIKRVFEETEPGTSYSHFSRLVRQRRAVPLPTAIRLVHNPGEKTQVDYADGLLLVDRDTGSETKTQFFCGVLPHSSLTFGEFTMSQKTRDFIESHERMWAYFGGVTPYVVLDNLKAGVIRAHRYDPDINPMYCDYANHAGFAAMPARVRTPRDKASVEASIGVIQRDFFDRHRATKFYSLHDLNTSFRRFLDDFNTRTMADYGVSRRNRFACEKDLLRPLPEKPYEIFEWKTAKVHPDCCIELGRAVYSVPYQYAHKNVRVKFSARMVIVLTESATETIAVHPRQPRFKHSILPEHLPPANAQLASFNVRRVRKFAEGIGPETTAYVDWQLEKEAAQPLRALRRLLGMMRIFEDESASRAAMEYAARLARNYSRRELSYFKNCVKTFKPSGEHLRLVSAPARREVDIHVRTNQGE